MLASLIDRETTRVDYAHLFDDCGFAGFSGPYRWVSSALVTLVRCRHTEEQDLDGTIQRLLVLLDLPFDARIDSIGFLVLGV